MPAVRKPLRVLRAEMLALLCLGACAPAPDTSTPPAHESAADAGAANPGLNFCGAQLPAVDLLAVASGELALAGALRQYGASAAELVLGLMHSLATRGIDFAKIASYQIAFRDVENDYVLTSGDGAKLAFSLSFAEDVAGFRAGEKLPADFFARASWLRDVQKVAGKKREMDYDAGPLFELIDGEVEFGGASTEDYRFGIRGDRIRFEMLAESTFARNGGEAFRLRLETPKPMSLSELVALLGGDGVELAYDASTFSSEARDFEEVMDRAAYTMRRDDSGWLWAGSYDATVHRDGFVRYVRGTSSGREQSYAEVYCDLERQDKAALAVHDLDLRGGTMTLEGGPADGALAYRLERP